MFDSKNFIRTEMTSYDGKKIIAWQEQSQLVVPFQIKVSQSGLLFEGHLQGEISTEGDLQKFAKFLSDCWTEHRKLAPKLVTTLAGH